MERKNNIFEEKEPLESGKKLENCVREGIEFSLETIKRSFENSTKEKNNLFFHNTEHAKNVVARTKKILLEMKKAEPAFVRDRDIKIGVLAASFHDIIQNWEESKIKEGPFYKTMRKRATGKNEEASAAALTEFMEKTNKEKGEEIFSGNDSKLAKEVVMATVPEFDSQKNTVIQPNLSKESSLIARALALTDIGAAGMDGAKQFLKEGDALFREENLDIFEALKKPEDIAEKQKDYFKKRIIKWSYDQIKFAAGRKDMFEKETYGLPENIQKRLRGLFSKFDESTKAATEKLKERKNMTFDELAKDIGYAV